MLSRPGKGQMLWTEKKIQNPSINIFNTAFTDYLQLHGLSQASTQLTFF